jgi:hypothetical protein
MEQIILNIVILELKIKIVNPTTKENDNKKLLIINEVIEYHMELILKNLKLKLIKIK